MDPLAAGSITRWHGTLLRDIRDDVVGRFRQGNEWVRVGSHLGANPAFVPDLVAAALERYERHEFASDLEAIAWFHCEFEILHTFVDGNGRIGRALINKQLQDLGLPPVIVRAKGRQRDYYPMLEQYSKTDKYAGVLRLLSLLLQESLHKRIAMVTSRRIIPLAEWARNADVCGNVAANRARRQTIPAFRVRDRWMIASEYDESAASAG